MPREAIVVDAAYSHCRGARSGNGGVCLGDTRLKGQVKKSETLNLVDAFDAKDAGDFSNVGENGFELAAVDDFEAGLDAGILTVGAALKAADIGAGAADDGGDSGEEARAVFGANRKLHRGGCGAFTAPLDGDAALCLVHEILHI